MATTWRMGDITFHFLYDGSWKGDGGVFFGIVPKLVWRRLLEVDEDNTFQVPCRPLLAEVGGKRILVESGLGDKGIQDERLARVWELRQPVTLREELKGLELTPEDIDYVILTHLHFDHAGGNTTRDPEGNLVPAFPRAGYLVQRREYAEARYPGTLGRNSYFAENLLPVEKAGQWDLLEGDTEILPGVETIVAGGHVPALQMVRFTSGGNVALFPGDLIPTSHNLRPAWNIAYDLDPATNTANKKRYLGQAARERWFILFYHDPKILLGRMEENGTMGQTVAAPVIDQNN